MPLSWITDIIWLNYPTNRYGLGVVFYMHCRAVVALLRPYYYACGERLYLNFVIFLRHKLLICLFAICLCSFVCFCLFLLAFIYNLFLLALGYFYLLLFVFACLPLLTSIWLWFLLFIYLLVCIYLPLYICFV